MPGCATGRTLRHPNFVDMSWLRVLQGWCLHVLRQIEPKHNMEWKSAGVWCQSPASDKNPNNN